MKHIATGLVFLLGTAAPATQGTLEDLNRLQTKPARQSTKQPSIHSGPHEEPPEAPPSLEPSAPEIMRHIPVRPQTQATAGRFVSVQVNIDAEGYNIPGDAANEPSIAVDPTDPRRITIGWRQFDTIEEGFREAGLGYSNDAGLTWTFPGVLEPGTFRSDPVLDVDAAGTCYYYSLSIAGGYSCEMFILDNGGFLWQEPVPAFGGDKPWIAIDRTGGIGRGNVYCAWSSAAGCCGSNIFTRTTDGGSTFIEPIEVPLDPRWGTLTVDPDGVVYLVGRAEVSGVPLARSADARHPQFTPVFELYTFVDLGGVTVYTGGPNPDGILGQVWVACDHSDGPSRGNVYILGSVDPPGDDPMEVMFVRSTDGGNTWSAPVRVNQDSRGREAWQWFGTMSVAPNGRIDVIWNDTRADPENGFSELYYSYSIDEGATWSPNTPLTPPFDHTLGYPMQNNKLGDYYDMVSDNGGVNVAYAATFNGEQDIYFLRLGPFDCNENRVPDDEDIAAGTSQDCNDNTLPDECEPDCNENGIADACDITSGYSYDCDGNVQPDECDPDFDGDRINDGCDPDIDGDGVLNETDVCDYTPEGMPVKEDGGPKGDANLDCRIDLSDYTLFDNCIMPSGPGTPATPEECADIYDFDLDGDVDALDYAGFVFAMQLN